jgi:hypothetical protein
MRDCILVEKCVALSLTSLGSRNIWMACGEQFGILDSIALIIVREFCHALKAHLMHLVKLSKLKPSRIAKTNVNFESLCGILLVLGAIDRSHISIITSERNLTNLPTRPTNPETNENYANSQLTDLIKKKGILNVQYC